MTETVYLLYSVTTGVTLGVFASTDLAAAKQAEFHQQGWRLAVKPWEVTR